jgi:hypothetical protein
MNIYENGQADARQSDGFATDSPFRKRYRQLTAEEVQLHDAIKSHAENLYQLLKEVPAGRERSLAFTKLEESIMWGIKALTA